MHTLLDPPKPKKARKPATKKAARKPGAKKAGIHSLPADEYLRLSKENERMITDSMAAADRGELVEYDSRKKR